MKQRTDKTTETEHQRPTSDTDREAKMNFATRFNTRCGWIAHTRSAMRCVYLRVVVVVVVVAGDSSERKGGGAENMRCLCVGVWLSVCSTLSASENMSQVAGRWVKNLEVILCKYHRLWHERVFLRKSCTSLRRVHRR